MKNIMIYTKHKKLNLPINLIKINQEFNFNIILLLTFYICGMIIGSSLLFLTDYNYSLMLNEVIKSLITDNNFYSILFLELFIWLSMILTAFCSGLSCVGIPLIYTLPLLEGIILGITYGSNLFSREVQGILNITGDLISGKLVLIMLSFIAFDCAIKMSYKLSRDLFNDIRQEKNLREYVIKFIIIFVLIILTIIVSVILRNLF